jgi:phosphate transport system substrate-binding protein
VQGIRVLPIDLNGNAQIDPNEDFYQDRDQIVQAIAENAYPSPPARDLHLVSQGRPKRKVVIEFIRWVLSSGQKYIPESGYINLTEQKLQDELRKLEGE